MVRGLLVFAGKVCNSCWNFNFLRAATLEAAEAGLSGLKAFQMLELSDCGPAHARERERERERLGLAMLSSLALKTDLICLRDIVSGLVPTEHGGNMCQNNLVPAALSI